MIVEYCNNFLALAVVAPGEGWRELLLEKLGGVCGLLPKSYSIYSKTKLDDFPYPTVFVTRSKI